MNLILNRSRHAWSWKWRNDQEWIYGSFQHLGNLKGMIFVFTFFFGGVDLSNHDWQINVYIIVVVSLTKSRLLFLLDVMWEMPQKRLWRFLAIKRWLMWIKVLSLTISFILFISYLNKFKFRHEWEFNSAIIIVSCIVVAVDHWEQISLVFKLRKLGWKETLR